MQQPTSTDDLTPEPVTELTEDERAAMRPGKPEPVEAPDDVDEDTATGYAVYDRTLARFVTPVTTDKPSSPAKAVAKGHSYKVVRV